MIYPAAYPYAQLVQPYLTGIILWNREKIKKEKDIETTNEQLPITTSFAFIYIL